MKDRYLYRAKRTDNGEFVEGSHVYTFTEDKDCPCAGIYKENHWIVEENGNMVAVDTSTICQCTGVPDKNGKKIYEKNIVVDEDGSIGIVEFGLWNNYSIGFYIRWLSGNAKYYRNELGYWASKIEVIGSALDNPELLEVGE